jgi:hypothetical protein
MMARQWRCGASDALHDSSHDLFCAGDDDHVRDDLNSATEIAAPPPPAAEKAIRCVFRQCPSAR